MEGLLAVEGLGEEACLVRGLFSTLDRGLRYHETGGIWPGALKIGQSGPRSLGLGMLFSEGFYVRMTPDNYMEMIFLLSSNTSSRRFDVCTTT